ncbi:hypothetical protein MPNT_30129 [Candidatus Methylacidithermus pantelleriae]|uniref:Uncharacterized protein n=1 Tax=Candidatus Methylacidithermus pantelleriae TaxID=2744239 RepID=A0A8J2BTK0_9BACT|nr:hypothetical protein MPNT_30129 [Candidatus Methylacidithermus pantelleriae]
MRVLARQKGNKGLNGVAEVGGNL